MRQVKVGETDAYKRTVSFQLVGTDGITPVTGKGGEQPEAYTNDQGSWEGAGSISTLSEVGNGFYTATVATAVLLTGGDMVWTRFKDGDTAECPGESLEIVSDYAATPGALSTAGLIVPAGTTQSVIVNGSKSGGTVGNVNSGSTKTIYVYVQSANGAAVTPTAIRYKRHDAKTKTQLKDWTTLTPGDPTVMTLSATDNALHNADRNSEQHVLTIEATYSDGSKATGEWFLGVERIEFA